MVATACEPRRVAQHEHDSSRAEWLEGCDAAPRASATSLQGEHILYGCAREERLEVLTRALADALVRANVASARTCLRAAGTAAQQLASARVTDARTRAPADAPSGVPLLHLAVREGEAETSASLVALLLSARASVNAVDGVHTQSALHVACALGISPAVELLLAHGAGAATGTVRSRLGSTPLMACLERAHTPERCECVRLLLRADVTVDGAQTRHRSGGFSYLHAASEQACATCVRALLARGADAGARAKRCGSAPLHRAATRDLSGECAALLLRARADPEARDTAGATPLHAGAAWLNVRAVRCILSELGGGAARRLTRLRDAHGHTPLHSLCAAFGQELPWGGWLEGCAGPLPGPLEPQATAAGAICVQLLGGGADPNTADGSQRTPLALTVALFPHAMALGRPALCACVDVCAVLISRGAAVSTQTLARLRGTWEPPASSREKAEGREAEVPPLALLCERALVPHIDRETVAPLHAAAMMSSAEELRQACEDYVLQLGGASPRELRAVLAQMVQPWPALGRASCRSGGELHSLFCYDLSFNDTARKDGAGRSPDSRRRQCPIVNCALSLLR